MLTGKVDSPEVRIEATRLSWFPRGVVEVINEIQVTEKASIKDAAKDLAASTTIKGKLVADKNIKLTPETKINNIQVKQINKV